MAQAVISSLSREYVYTEVTAKGQDAATLVTLPVEWAFLTSDTAEPTSGDWKAGSWVSGADPATARCLVGPAGTATLAEGVYYCWLRITGATEQPVRQLKNTLTIT